MLQNDATLPGLQSDTIKKLHIKRLFSTSDNATLATRILNQKISTDSEIFTMAVTLGSYLPMQWAVKYVDQDNPFATIWGNKEKIDLLCSIMAHVSQTERQEIERYYRKREDAQDVLDTIDAGMSFLQTWRRGRASFVCIDSIHIHPERYETINSVSKYNIRKNYLDGVSDLNEYYGDQLNVTLFSHMRNLHCIEEESNRIYQDTQLFLESYARLHNQYITPDIIKKRLDSIDAKTKEQYTVEELYDFLHPFLAFMGEAIDRVRAFPCEGELLYDVLKAEIEMIAENKTIQEASGKVCVGRATYYRTRRVAMEVLGNILWGYSIRSVIYLMSKGKHLM